MNRFSIAIKQIDRAMIGSTIIEGIFIISSTPRNNVIVCAKVKIEICSIKGLNFEVRRNKARTNNIWSKPLGIMCLKPSWVYDLILSIRQMEET